MAAHTTPVALSAQAATNVPSGVATMFGLAAVTFAPGDRLVRKAT
jgi:hypothetical protein